MSNNTTKNYSRIEIGNTNMLEALSLRSAYLEEFNTISGVYCGDKRAIVCGNEVTGCVSKSYPLITYNEIKDCISDSLISTGLDIVGTFNVSSKRLYGDMTFKNICIADDSKGIAAGISVRSNYIGSGTIEGSAYFKRLSCANGMMSKNIIPGLTIKISHRSEITLEQIVTGFKGLIERVLNSSNKWQKVIDSAISQTITFESEKELVAFFQSIYSSERRAKSIGLEYMKKNTALNSTIWDLYNDITYRVSHELTLTPPVRDNILLNAEKILTGEITPIAILA